MACVQSTCRRVPELDNTATNVRFVALWLTVGKALTTTTRYPRSPNSAGVRAAGENSNPPVRASAAHPREDLAKGLTDHRRHRRIILAGLKALPHYVGLLRTAFWRLSTASVADESPPADERCSRDVCLLSRRAGASRVGLWRRAASGGDVRRHTPFQCFEFTQASMPWDFEIVERVPGNNPAMHHRLLARGRAPRSASAGAAA